MISRVALPRPTLVLGAVTAAVLLAAGSIVFLGPASGGHAAIADLSLPVILGAGFVDGFNPCAFGVLLLFATFALGLAARASQLNGQAPARPSASHGSMLVLRLGAFFVVGVLAAYFLLGVGLLTVVASASDFGNNHLPSRIAALAAIALGVWMLRDVLLPDARWKLEAPHALHGRMRAWARASSPAALFAGGALVGLCTVPCSGAVYLGVVALLGTSGNVAAGLGGLLLYNLAYIAPLVLLLFLASRPGLIRVVNRWHLEHATATKTALAAVVLGLGFAILITV